MTEADYAYKLDELDRLLNDPEVAMEPARICICWPSWRNVT